MSLVARHLEASGIATVVAGSARDIVEQCGVPRFLFTDFPLGNPCGKPGNTDMQSNIVSMALTLAESAVAARTTVQTPYLWGDDTWREAYMAVDPSKTAEYLAAGEVRRAQQAAAPTRS